MAVRVRVCACARVCTTIMYTIRYTSHVYTRVHIKRTRYQECNSTFSSRITIFRDPQSVVVEYAVRYSILFTTTVPGYVGYACARVSVHTHASRARTRTRTRSRSALQWFYLIFCRDTHHFPCARLPFLRAHPVHVRIYAK